MRPIAPRSHRKKTSSPDAPISYTPGSRLHRTRAAGGAQLDEAIRDRLDEVWESASESGLSLWLTNPSGTLAYILVTNQFPRNMYRDDARSFTLGARRWRQPVRKAA